MDASRLMSYEFDQLPPLEVFPDGEVSVGQEWSHTYTVRGADGREKKVTMKSRLFSYDAGSGEAWIISDSTFPGDMQFGAELGNFNATGSTETHSVQLFNAKQGKFTRGTTVIRGDWRFTFEINGMKLDVGVLLAGSGTMIQP